MKRLRILAILALLLFPLVHGSMQTSEGSGDVVLLGPQTVVLANSKISTAANYSFMDFGAGNSTIIAPFVGETIEICQTSDKSKCVRGVIGAVGTGETGADLLTGWDFTSGWVTRNTATIIDSNSFTAASSSGIYFNTPATYQHLYKLVSSGTTADTSPSINFFDLASIRTEILSSVTTVGKYITLNSDSIKYVYIRHGNSPTESQTDMTAMSFTKVLTPSATGFWIRSLTNSTDGNAWSQKHASFDPNSATGFTYRIISTGTPGKLIDGNSTIASTNVRLATVDAGAMVQIVGKDLSPYAGDDAGGPLTIINPRSATGATMTTNKYYVCLYSSGGSACGYAGAVGGGASLDAEKATGTLTIGKAYTITATELDHFGTGFTVGRYFNAPSALTCDANNKVQEVLEVAATGLHLHSTPGGTDRKMARVDATFNPNAVTAAKIYQVAPDGGNLDSKFQGVSWNESADTYARTGSLKGTATAVSAGNAKLPIQSLMKRVVLADNGTIAYSLCATDSTLQEDCATASDLTGAAGQVMVEIPAFYYRYNYTGPTHTWEISTTPLLGFALHPAFVKDGANVAYRYIGAYEGVLYDVSGSAYTDGNTTSQVKDFTATTGNKLSSVSGIYPVVKGTRANFRTIAANRGTGWRQLDYDLHSAVQLLYLVEYASFYSQSMIGAGISNVTDWAAYNSSYPLARSGNSNVIGNATGNTAGSTSALTESTKYMSFRGIEQWFGHLWKFVDGINSNSGRPYATNVRANFADDTTTNYTDLGANMGTTSGNQNTLIQVSRGFLPASVGASSSSKITDYYWYASGWRVLLVGGDSSNGVMVGGFCVFANGGSATLASTSGGRVCY